MTKNEWLDASFELGPTLGKGTYSEVLLAKRKVSLDELGGSDSDDSINANSPDVVAIKRISKSRLISSEERLIPQREIEVHEAIGKHPNAVFMFDSFEDENSVFLVLEMVNGGTLAEQIRRNPLGMPSKPAKEIIHQILLAVHHLHERNLVHVDISPSNILIDEKSGNAKLCDFGMTQRSRSNSQMDSPSNTSHVSAVESGAVYGTRGYVAPEVLSGSLIDEKADIWSLGMVCYELLTGMSPFAILSGNEVRFPDEFWADKNPLARDFTEKLLLTNPTERPCIGEALKHPWFAEN